MQHSKNEEQVVNDNSPAPSLFDSTLSPGFISFINSKMRISDERMSSETDSLMAGDPVVNEVENKEESPLPSPALDYETLMEMALYSETLNTQQTKRRRLKLFLFVTVPLFACVVMLGSLFVMQYPEEKRLQNEVGELQDEINELQHEINEFEQDEEEEGSNLDYSRNNANSTISDGDSRRRYLKLFEENIFSLHN